jgi:hypothetical protein
VGDGERVDEAVVITGEEAAGEGKRKNMGQKKEKEKEKRNVK